MLVSSLVLEGDLKDALLCSVSGDKVILHFTRKHIMIYNRQSHEIERYGCPNGLRSENAKGKPYTCFCNVTSDAVYHGCLTYGHNIEGIEIKIHKLVGKSMINVKTLKYDNARYFSVYGSTFYIEVNGRWITFSFELMKEIVINNNESVAVFAHRDRFYALNHRKLYPLDLSNAGEQIELSDGDTIKGDAMVDWFLKTHNFGEDVIIVNSIGQLWRLNMTNRKIEKLPVKPTGSSCAFCGNVLYYKEYASQAIHTLDLTPYLRHNHSRRETTTQEELISEVSNTPTNVVEILELKKTMCAASTCPVCREMFQNPKVMPKCGHSVCVDCEVQISVQDPIQKKKTLTCPMCRSEAQLNIAEYLPVNWALKNLLTLHDSQGGSPNGPRLSLHCSSCNEPLSEKKTFDCEFCAERDQKTEVLICGACGLLYHNDRASRVKLVTFADAAYKKGKIGGISRDPEEPKREKSAMASTLMEVNKEFDIFFGGLEKDYERVNNRLEKLRGDCPITQKVVDKESEELMKDDGVIKKKLEKLSIWKITLQNISQPSHYERRLYTSLTRDLKNLRTRRGSPNGSRHSIKCSSCNEPLSEKTTFDCEFCAERDQKTEVLICEMCGIDYHAEHIKTVKHVTFADAAYKKEKIGGISRDPEEPKRQKSAMASTLMDVNKEFDVFFGGLEKDYERVNSRLKKLGGDGSITQKMMYKESEELMKDDGVIKKKLKKLSTWKVTLRNISQLNSDD